MADEVPEEKEDEKPKSKKESEALSLLQQVRKEKEDMDAKVEELKKLKQDYEEMRAKDILAGRSDAGQEPAKPKDMTEREYLEAWKKGELKVRLPGT